MISRAIVIAALALAIAGCKDEPKSTRWEDAAPAAPAPIASTGPVTAGGHFNAAFPPDGVDGYTRIFTQEKDGFAEAKLQKDGKDVATLSISDTNANADPAAKGKFADAPEKLGEWPMTTVGKNQTTVLVKDRYQVKVSSMTLDHEARKKLLEKFDLKRL